MEEWKRKKREVERMEKRCGVKGVMENELEEREDEEEVEGILEED